MCCRSAPAYVVIIRLMSGGCVHLLQDVGGECWTNTRWQLMVADLLQRVRRQIAFYQPFGISRSDVLLVLRHHHASHHHVRATPYCRGPTLWVATLWLRLPCSACWHALELAALSVTSSKASQRLLTTSYSCESVYYGSDRLTDTGTDRGLQLRRASFTFRSTQ